MRSEEIIAVHLVSSPSPASPTFVGRELLTRATRDAMSVKFSGEAWVTDHKLYGRLLVDISVLLAWAVMPMRVRKLGREKMGVQVNGTSSWGRHK